MINLAVLITVFNRVDKTVLCLNNLFNNEGHNSLFILDVFLVDDGSTDGTYNIIKEQFPEINIIKGTGQLYWNKGMFLAWEKSLIKGKHDGYLWLNNDTFLFNNAVLKIINAANNTNWKALICGSISSPHDANEITYGGRVLNRGKYNLVYPNIDLQEIDTINGNFVLVPDYVYKVVGNLDPKFTHAVGDFDYGLRVKKAGIKLYATGFIGTCEKNNTVPVWKNPGNPFLKRVINLYHPLGRNEPHKFFYYTKRHFGLLSAIRIFVSQHIRVLFPSLIKNSK